MNPSPAHSSDTSLMLSNTHLRWYPTRGSLHSGVMRDLIGFKILHIVQPVEQQMILQIPEESFHTSWSSLNYITKTPASPQWLSGSNSMGTLLPPSKPQK